MCVKVGGLDKPTLRGGEGELALLFHEPNIPRKNDWRAATNDVREGMVYA